MQTVARYQNLAKVPAGQQRLKALAEAINLDLALPQMFLDLQGGKAANQANVHSPGGAKAIELPNVERVKAFLAQKYTTPSDTPALSDVAASMTQVFHTNMPSMDLGWTNIFNVMDLRSSLSTEFEILDTNAGITFTQRAPGEEVKVRRNIFEDLLTVRMLEFADAVGLLDIWLDYQKWWNVSNVVAEFVAKAWDKKAEFHYDLIQALGSGINIAFSTDATQTFNNAASSIVRALDGKGIPTNGPFKILTSPERVGYILKMLEAQRGSSAVAFGASVQPLAYTVDQVIATPHVPNNATGYYLILPGRKLQSGNWKDLTTETDRDIYKAASDIVARMRFNAAVGEADQVRRVAFA